MIARKASLASRLELTTIERGGALLRAHTGSITNIRSMIGVPQQHWRHLYQPLFVAFAELVQGLPVSDDLQQQEPSGSLQRALQRVVLALKLRRGYVLPPAKEPEAVAEEQDVWTYAVVTAALLHDIGATLIDQHVTLFGRDQLPLAVWSPWVGPMTETRAKRYRSEVKRTYDNEVHKAVTPLLVHCVVPADGLRWLGCHADALAAWLNAIGNQSAACTIIAEIVHQADQLVGGRIESNAPRQLAIPGTEVRADDNVTRAQGAAAERTDIACERRDVEPHEAASIPATSSASEEVNLGIEKPPTEHRKLQLLGSDGHEETADSAAGFVNWLIDGLGSGALAINTPKARVHVVNEGLLLISPAVFRAFAGDEWREVQKRFLRQRLSKKTNTGENFFHYVLDTDRGKKTLKGVVIGNPGQKLGVTLPRINQRLSHKFGGG